MFARKLLLNREEIENEKRAIKKLYGRHAHENLVKVLRLGTLVKSSIYFIDMELCDLNLNDYIYPKGETQVSIPRLVETPSSLKVEQIWNIMNQIANGLTFIHSQTEIHRDLKPSNSMPYKSLLTIIFSPVFAKRLCMENRGLWIHLSRNIKRHTLVSCL